MSITKATIKNAEPTDKKYFVWDTKLSGLGIRVMPSGVKSWVLSYRTESGVKRLQTLGRADIYHPDQARDVALKILLEAKSGKDPASIAVSRRHTPTVSQLCDQFESVHFRLLKPGTAKNYRALVRRWIKPRFGDRLVTNIIPADIRQWKSDATKPVTFNHARNLMAQMFDYAEENHWIDNNPLRTRSIKNYVVRQRKRYLTSSEVPRLAAALSEYSAQSDIRFRFASLISLLLLTGCRLNELAQAKVEWIDFEQQKINWPDTKTGADSLYIPNAAIELMRELVRRVPGNPYLIAGARLGQPLVGVRKMWREVCVMANIDNLRVHDLRKSFASIALAEDIGLDVIAGLLRHSNPAITAERYAFLIEEKRATAAEAAANAISKRLSAS